eukprot:1891657-Pyramimonas_sp.AAC.1
MLEARAGNASVTFPLLDDGSLEPLSFLANNLAFFHLDRPCEECASDEYGAQSNPSATTVALYLGLCADWPIQHPSSQQIA